MRYALLVSAALTCAAPATARADDNELICLAVDDAQQMGAMVLELHETRRMVRLMDEELTICRARVADLREAAELAVRAEEAATDAREAAAARLAECEEDAGASPWAWFLGGAAAGAVAVVVALIAI